MGVCTANVAFGSGSGSVFQYFIPDWEGRMFTTGRPHRFGAQPYP